MRQISILPKALRLAVLALITFVFLCVPGCGGVRPNPKLKDIPKRMVWAWERPEDLRFLDPQKFGVAFLAQTITLQGPDVLVRSRRQPLEVSKGAYLMAVTRIETVKDRESRPEFSPSQLSQTADLIEKTLTLPDVKAVQIDFDAVVSERAFYEALLKKVKEPIPDATPLSITSLASWCVGDRWLNGLPVDEVVPMAFDMGRDEQRIREFLKGGNDWNESLCRQSYGLLPGDDLLSFVDRERRIYFYKPGIWKRSDLKEIDK